MSQEEELDREIRGERAQTEKLQKFGELIGDIYEAALDRRLWPGVLLRLVRFVDGTASGLSLADVIAHFRMVHLGQGIDELDEQVNPDSDKHIATGSEDCLAASGRSLDLGDRSRKIVAIGSRAEWNPAQGLFNLSALFEGFTAAGVFRRAHDCLANTEAFDRMRMITPHLQRAIEIGRLIESRKDISATFACVVDGLDAAVFLIDADGCILHANAAAGAVVAPDEILRIRAGGRLAAGDAAADRGLQDMLAVACRGDSVPDSDGASVPLTGKDGVRFVAHVLPLKSGARDRSGIGGDAAVALFVRKVLVPASSASEAIGKAFKLTPAEQRVLRAIAELGGVPTVASALGLSEATVKTHLVHIFKKTGVSQQQGLVKLVARYSTPLAR